MNLYGPVYRYLVTRDYSTFNLDLGKLEGNQLETRGLNGRTFPVTQLHKKDGSDTSPGLSLTSGHLGFHDDVQRQM